MANTGIYDDDFDDIDSVLAAESDTDSNFADSPADGYFSERQHPTDVFVENSSVSAEAEAKAREAAEQRASSSSAQVPPSQRRSASPSRRSIAWSEVHPSHINTEAPPPDYEAATQASSSRYVSPASPTHFQFSSITSPQHESQSPLGGGNQGHFRYHGNAPQPMGLPSRPLPIHGYGGSNIAAGQPQSMSDPTQPGSSPDEETGLLTQRPSRKYSRWYRLRRRLCGPTSTCNIILIIAAVILIIVLTGSSDSDTANDGDDKWKPPDHSHEDDGTPTKPISPALPTLPPPTQRCPYDYYSDTTRYGFHALDNFTFGEFIDQSDHLSGGVDGTILIRPAQEDQHTDIQLSVKYATTPPWKDVKTHFTITDDEFILRSPDLGGTADSWSKRPCMYVFIRIEVRPGVSLENFDLTTSNLNVEVADGLFSKEDNDNHSPSLLNLQAKTSITAVQGNILIPYWSSRETEIEVISGSITGSFALRDLLSLKTQSGHIDVSVDPQKIDKNRPRPASSLFKTTAGSIKVKYPQEGYIPERDYTTRVESISSSVSGSLILGSQTSLLTASGSINFSLLPFFDRSAPASFHTETVSGSTKLAISSPYDHPDEPWSKPPFTHKSISKSGTINLSYPEEWEGGISAAATSASITVKGKGVHIIKDTKLGPMRAVEAIRGVGNNRLEVQSVRGSIKILAGEE